MSPSLPRRERFVQVEFSPACGCLESLVSLVTDFCRNVVDDPDIGFAFRMAAFELTENVVKYGTGDRATLQISVNHAAEGRELVLSVENEASAGRLRDAHERLLAGEAAADPVAHFDNLVRDTLNSPRESRLGLGRLRAETRFALSHRVSERAISICVRHRVHSPRAEGN